MASSGSSPGRVQTIAIIGAGWYGCHLATVLMGRGHKVTVFEQGSDIFQGASGKTQFRLHKGFHYPRSYKTRTQIVDSYETFLARYPTLVTDIPQNIYGVATSSPIDFGTYVQVMSMSGADFKKVSNPGAFGLTGLEGLVVCDEKALFVDAPVTYFKERLKDVLRLSTTVMEVSSTLYSEGNLVRYRDTVGRDAIGNVEGEFFDWCINCTYCQFHGSPIKELDLFYEPCLTLILRKKHGDVPSFALTVMDGEYISLYPYIRDAAEKKDFQLFTLTHVKHTPLGQFRSFGEAEKYRKVVDRDELCVRERAEKFYEGARQFLPHFDRDWELDSWFTSIKTKPRDAAASRECIVRCEDRCIHVLSGKVNTIIQAEVAVLRIIEPLSDLGMPGPEEHLEDHDATPEEIGERASRSHQRTPSV